MVELMIALVAVLALTGGLLQAVSLARVQNEALVKAREKAGQLAMQSVEALASPEYIRYWLPGPDESPLTRDDTHTVANPDDFRHVIVNKAAATPEEWTAFESVPKNAVEELRHAVHPVNRIGLVGVTEERKVPLLPIVRSLLYNREAVDVKCCVWLTWTTGLY